MSPPESPQNTPLLSGQCICGQTTYTLLAPPLATHCCHCTYCQHETGSAFALNTLIEAYNFKLTSPTPPVYAARPAPSGTPHLVAHCANPACNTDLFAHYAGNTSMVYVKVGTLSEEGRRAARPDVHIFARSKVEWVSLGAEVERGVRVCEEFYEFGEVWGEESLRRLAALRAWREREGK